MNKQEIVKELQSKGVKFDEHAKKEDLEELLLQSAATPAVGGEGDPAATVPAPENTPVEPEPAAPSAPEAPATVLPSGIYVPKPEENHNAPATGRFEVYQVVGGYRVFNEKGQPVSGAMMQGEAYRIAKRHQMHYEANHKIENQALASRQSVDL